MANGNANGTRQLARMELEFKGQSYAFTINPEVYELKLSNKINLQYTKVGAFIDAYGEGIKELSIIGTTGFRGNKKDPEEGYNKFVEFKKLIERSMNDVKFGEELKDFLKFYNHTDGEAYVCVPIRLGLSRNVNQPLLYKYDLSMYAIRRVGDPVPKANIQVVGNPLGTPSTKDETVNDRDKVEKGKEDSKFTLEHNLYVDGIDYVEGEANSIRSSSTRIEVFDDNTTSEKTFTSTGGNRIDYNSKFIYSNDQNKP